MKTKGRESFWVGLLVSVLLAESAGFIGAIYTTPAINSWYIYLNKAALNPPSWVFAPVWTVLYLLMGWAAYLVFRERAKGQKLRLQAFGLSVYAIQLIFNVWWSILFFGQHRLAEASVEIISLWALILVTIIAFGQIKKEAAWLLAPYLAWVSFASYLCISVWLLN